MPSIAYTISGCAWQQCRHHANRICKAFQHSICAYHMHAILALHRAIIWQATQNSSNLWFNVVSEHPAGRAGHEEQSSFGALNMATNAEGQPSHLKHQNAAREYSHTANHNIYVLADVRLAAANLIQARSSSNEKPSQHKCWADIQIDHGSRV